MVKLSYLLSAAAIVLLAVAIGARISMSKVESPKVLGTDLYGHVEGCLEDVSISGLQLMGERGRIYSPIYLEHDDRKISYLYYKGARMLSSDVADYENDIERFVLENILDCTARFTAYRFSVDDEISVRASFSEDSLDVVADIPIMIEDIRQTYSEFHVQVPSRFLSMHAVAEEIFNRTVSDPEWLDIEYLQSLPIKVQVEKIEAGTVVYTMTEDEYHYSFAIKVSR